MSYRTFVNGIQIFGNNEYYPEWIDFIKSQGIEIGEEDDYDGEIKDVMKALETIENIVLRLETAYRANPIDRYSDNHFVVSVDEEGNQKEYKSLFDFSNVYDNLLEEKRYPIFLTDRLFSLQNNAYMFMPLVFLNACGDCIKRTKISRDILRLNNFVLVDGKTIHVSAM